MQWQCFLEFIAENGQGAIEKITQNWQVKIIVGVIGAGLVSVYEYVGAPVFMFMALVTADLVTKLIAIGQQAMKKNGVQGNYLYAIWYAVHKNAAQSRPMRTKGVNKIVQYIFVLIAAALLGRVIPTNFSEYSSAAFDWILFYLSVGEVKSIFENLQEAGMEEASFFVRVFGDKQKRLEDKMTGK